MVMVKGKSKTADAKLENDGSISAEHSFFGFILMVVFVAAAQSLTLLRPTLF